MAGNQWVIPEVRYPSCRPNPERLFLPHYGRQAAPLPTLCSPRRRRGRNRGEPFAPPSSGPPPRASRRSGARHQPRSACRWPARAGWHSRKLTARRLRRHHWSSGACGASPNRSARLQGNAPAAGAVLDERRAFAGDAPAVESVLGNLQARGGFFDGQEFIIVHDRVSARGAKIGGRWR